MVFKNELQGDEPFHDAGFSVASLRGRCVWRGWSSGRLHRELLQDGDIVCLLEGLSQPSVLRICADYYTMVL